uniref:Trehalase n=1 Tax=Timema cristinae TaxID=61476 RepID=A0A7R9CTA4_TIMCR|nr:unnamed protein product [Timema cristinae]
MDLGPGLLEVPAQYHSTNISSTSWWAWLYHEAIFVFPCLIDLLSLCGVAGGSISHSELSTITVHHGDDELGLPEKALEYMKYAEEWMESVNEILWHEDVGAWLDYDIMNNVRRNYFYPTNIAPLWTGCFDIRKGRQQIAKILKYLEKTRIMINLGGIPATLEQSGEQWDYPNAWPPLQYIMIYALDASGDDWAKELAYQISEKWVRSNYKTFNETSAMYEKYDATVSGGHGSGGEYNVQLGFGWTNGVIMELLDKYGDRLTAEDRFEDNKPLVASIAVDGSVSTFGQVLTLVLALVVPLVIGCIG